MSAVAQVIHFPTSLAHMRLLELMRESVGYPINADLPPSVLDLASQLEISQAEVTGLLCELEEQGLVVACRWKLTEDGRA